MTLEELCGFTADQWDKLTDKDLERLAEPFKNVTRPEYAPKPTSVAKKFEPVDPRLRRNAELLAGLGVDISHLLVPHRRKK